MRETRMKKNEIIFVGENDRSFNLLTQRESKEKLTESEE